MGSKQITQNPTQCTKTNANIGGQAIIEGVLFRDETKISMAVRKPDGSIVKKIINLSKRKKVFKAPFLRGGYSLIDLFVNGVKALNISAAIVVGEGKNKEGKNKKSKNFTMILALIFGVVFALILFKLIPLAIAQVLNIKGRIAFNLVEGLSKIGIFVLYVYAISSIKDIKRILQYHGAEHKVANCYEAGKKLTLANVKQFSTIHKRCGTTFMIIVLLISILIYTLIPLDIGFWSKYALRIALLPIIAALSYEILRLKTSLKYPLIAPALLLQKLTTKEPADSQIQVALKAFEGLKLV